MHKEIHDIQFVNNFKQLIVLNCAGSIKIIDNSSFKEIQTIKENVQRLLVSSNQNYLFLVKANQIDILQAKNYKKFCSLKTQFEFVKNSQVSDLNKILIIK